MYQQLFDDGCDILIKDQNLAVSFRNFSFIYSTDIDQKPTLFDINFNLFEGETLIIAGSSGSGKSTLTYAMNGIIPWRLKGFAKGDVYIYDKNIWNYKYTELCKIVGVVKQNPLDQLVTFTVRDEIAFGLENLKFSKEEITNRVNEITQFMQIDHLLDRDINQLSGGQKQLVILCSFLVMKPKILILDEPIAFLDHQSEHLLLNQLRKLKKSKDYNLTLIIVEHRLNRVLDIADKILILSDDGTVRVEGDIQRILKEEFELVKISNLRIPWILEIYNMFISKVQDINLLDNNINFQNFINYIGNLKYQDLQEFKNILIDTIIEPTIIREYEEYEQIIDFENLYINSLKNKFNNHKNEDEKSNLKINKSDNIILETKNLSFTYPNSGIKAIKNLSIKIKKGEFIGLIGPNGSGKTTFLYLLANLYDPTSGTIYFKNIELPEIDQNEYSKKIGFIFQNPEKMIFKSSIKDEILYGAKNFKLLDDISEKYLSKLIKLIGKEDPDKNPFQLSWGQKRRLNLSCIFIYNPDIILLDEPFIGQDQRTIDFLIETLYIENKRGKTIIISSHDYQLLLKYTNRIIELDKGGKLKTDDSNENFFSKNKKLGPMLLLDKINRRLNDLSK